MRGSKCAIMQTGKCTNGQSAKWANGNEQFKVDKVFNVKECINIRCVVSKNEVVDFKILM